MDISHTCKHCFKGRKVYRVTLDLYNDEGILRRGVQQMKKFEFTCEYCSKKSFLDKQNELLDMLNKLIYVLEEYVKS